MIPTPEQLAAIGQMSEGNLRQVPFAALLCSLAMGERTATIELRRNQLEKKIVLDAGSPVECRSNLAHETLGRFLISEKKLTEEQFNTCLAKAAAKGVPLGEVLVEAELIGAFELYRSLQQNLAKKLLDCFTWREGTFEIKRDPPAVDSTLKVKAPQLIVTGITKFASQEEVDKSVVPLIGKSLLLHPAPQFALDEIKLPAAQRRLLDSLQKEFRIDELASASDLPYEDVTRLLYALAVIGIVVRAELVPPNMRRQPAQAPKPAKPAAPPQPAPDQPPAAGGGAPPPKPAMTPGEQDKLRDEIMQAYLGFRRQDGYDLFKLDESAPAAAIDEAFVKFSRRFNPWALTGTELESMADKARDIYLGGARAYAELADPAQRELLLDRRAQKREEHRRSLAAGRFAIKTDLLDPSVQFRKGKALMEASHYREAIQLLEFAADCDSQNSEYRAELAWCRFMDSPPLARQSLAELKEAMRIDPQCGLAVFYAGEINRLAGNKAESEPLLRKACKMMAPDRRPVEALKALLTAK